MTSLQTWVIVSNRVKDNKRWDFAEVLQNPIFYKKSAFCLLDRQML